MSGPERSGLLLNHTGSRSMGSATTATCCAASLAQASMVASAAFCFAAIRDISTVHFWDAESQRYCAIPYRNTTFPAMNLWELREIRRKLGESGEAHADEAAIFAAYARLREHESRATTETKRARRVRVRRPVAPALLSSEPPSEPVLLSDPADIVPFAIEELS